MGDSRPPSGSPSSDYVPFGPEWEKEMMKHPKAFIVSMLKKACTERETAKEWVSEARRESMLLAMMAADEPMFFNPLLAMEAKEIRDRLLTPINASPENS